jgi:hypothetical protein
MPLLVNGQESKYVPKDAKGAEVIDPKYLGNESTTSKSDTYSVLAVLGVSGSADTTTKAEVGIAQYFATGLAARTLAIAGGSLVNTSSAAADASKVTAQAAAKTDVALAAISTTKRDVLIAGMPLDKAYLSMTQSNPGKKSDFDLAVQPAFKDYADFSINRSTLDQVNKVKAQLEKDSAIKAEIEKQTPTP